jgi:hypothetical protein
MKDLVNDIMSKTLPNSNTEFVEEIRKIMKEQITLSQKMDKVIKLANDIKSLCLPE